MDESQNNITVKESDTRVLPFIRSFTTVLEIRSVLAGDWGEAEKWLQKGERELSEAMKALY